MFMVCVPQQPLFMAIGYSSYPVQLLRCVFCHILDMCWGCLLLQQCQNGPCYEEPFRAVWSIRRGPVTSGNAASQCGVRG